MKSLALLLIISFSMMASPGELAVGVGKTLRYNGDGLTGAVASVSWYGEKWRVRAMYFGDQTIYRQWGGLTVDHYAALVVSRLWTFRRDKRVSPWLGAGLMLKGSQRCKWNGDLDCNRVVPLMFAFCEELGTGLPRADLRLSLNHCSNDSFDWGPEAKNLGQDFILPELTVWRSK